MRSSQLGVGEVDRQVGEDWDLVREDNNETSSIIGKTEGVLISLDRAVRDGDMSSNTANTVVSPLIVLFENEPLTEPFRSQMQFRKKRSNSQGLSELLLGVWRCLWDSVKKKSKQDHDEGNLHVGKMIHHSLFVQAQVAYLSLTLLLKHDHRNFDSDDDYKAELGRLDAWGQYLVELCENEGKQRVLREQMGKIRAQLSSPLVSEKAG